MDAFDLCKGHDFLKEGTEAGMGRAEGWEGE